jgi:integrase
MPLTTVTADTLNAMVSHFRSRPLTQRQKPMAIDTVQETLKTLRSFFDWCDLTGRWEAPRRFERLFRVKYQSLKTLSERRSGANGQKVFTLTELQQLWQAATDQQRLHLGLALNTGETAQGIADLTKTDLKTGSQWSVDRHRAKTGVRGVYALWPPVQELLVRFINTDASEQRLLTTLEGNPLVWVTENWRCDTVAKLWAKLMKRVPLVSQLSFKYLRKTGASMIYEITGSIDVVELYLSHAGRGVAQKHYLTRNTDWLAKPLQELGERLATAMSMVAITSAEKIEVTTDCR